ncbi:MAG TPA: hypothetical protein VKR52_04690 [Terracidiphilus sp.]|nr:hypothetical protein [Terracidiphilus sp.]
MPNPVRLLDNGTDISNLVDWKSLDFVSVLTKETGTGAFNIKCNAANLPAGLPQIGDTIELYDSSGLMWGGILTEQEPIIAGLMVTYQYTATDWGFLFDGELVKKNYAGMDPADIVADIVNTFCAGKGFNLDGVQRGNFLVETIKFNYQQPSKALQSLAKLIGWDWFIGPDKTVYFFLGDVDDGSGGGAVGDGGVAPITIDATSGKIEWNSLDIDLQITNMQNSVYVIGGTLPVMFTASNTNDVYPTNGTANTFPVAYAYSSSTIVVELNGVPQSVGILNQVTDPATVDVLYSDSGRFIQFTAGAPTGGQVVKIFGTAQVPIVAHASNAASVATYGERQGVVTDSTITSVPEAQLRAQAQILQFGHPVYDLKVNTITPGCRIGQTIKVNVPAMGITNYNLVIKRIEAVGFAPGPNGMLEYQIECIGSDNVTFTDLMTTILQQEQTQTDVSDDTITEDLQEADETLAFADTVTATAGSRPYLYGPTSPQPRYGFAVYS